MIGSLPSIQLVQSLTRKVLKPVAKVLREGLGMMIAIYDRRKVEDHQVVIV